MCLSRYKGLKGIAKALLINIHVLRKGRRRIKNQLLRNFVAVGMKSLLYEGLNFNGLKPYNLNLFDSRLKSLPNQ